MKQRLHIYIYIYASIYVYIWYPPDLQFLYVFNTFQRKDFVCLRLYHIYIYIYMPH